MSARISLIAAMARNGVIGRGNRLPWRLSEDLKRFKRLTVGHPIIVGRKTFESFGRPLPDRPNLVLTRSPEVKLAGAEVFARFEDALARARELDPSEVFVVGGAEIYRMALPLADRLYLTLIDHDVEGDAHFPEWDASRFRLVEEEMHAEPFAHRFATYDRV